MSQLHPSLPVTAPSIPAHEKLGNAEGPDNFTDCTPFSDTDPCCFDEHEELQDFAITFQLVVYSVVFLLGVVGNGLMITVLLRRRHLLRIAEIYLLHLAIADLMLLITFPFGIVELVYGWLFGEFLCKLRGLMESLNLFCGCFLLACIGLDRYLAVVHAIPSMKSRRPKVVHLTCILLWLVCLGSSIPNAVFLNVTGNNTEPLTCFYDNYGIHGSNWVLARSVFNHFCFFLPMAIMSYCYTALAVFLCKSQKSQAKQGAIRLSLLVTFIFAVCWLPYNITLLIDTMVYVRIISYDNCGPDILLDVTLGVTKSIGLSHCCLNPFLYAFVGVRFRNELIQLLCRLGCSRICLPFIRPQGHSRPSISEGATTISSANI